MKVVTFSAIGLGLLLLIVGSLWATLFSAESAWTEEKSLRQIEVQTRLSNLGPLVNSTKPRMHAGADPATLKTEFDALMKENDQLNAEFESARDNPRKASKLLRWSGVGLMAIGLIGWYAVKDA